MEIPQDCFDANRRWAARMCDQDPRFFERLRDQQCPELLWIGCSDSRLPPDRIIGKQPGEIFVHRNVGNVVVHTDINCLSVLQYGVEVLCVRHVIVCGHYGCGGVRAALQSRPLGLIDNWLRHIRDVQLMNRDDLNSLANLEAREDRLCELNVIAQVANVCRTNIVQDAWRRGCRLSVHGWIYSLRDGLLRDLEVSVDRAEQIPARCACQSRSIHRDRTSAEQLSQLSQGRGARGVEVGWTRSDSPRWSGSDGGEGADPEIGDLCDHQRAALHLWSTVYQGTKKWGCT